LHNYEKKIIQLQAEGKLPAERGKVYDFKVAHDDWCRVYNGGECNCDPDMTAVEITDRNRQQVAKMIAVDSAEFRKEVDKKKV